MSTFQLHGIFSFKKKNILLNANFVFTFFLSLFSSAFITEKRANAVYPKIFDVFVSDWPKFLMNIHEESLSSPRIKQVVFLWRCLASSKTFGALRQLERLWEDEPPRKKSTHNLTSTEGKIRFLKDYIRSVKEYKTLLDEVNTCVELVFVFRRLFCNKLRSCQKNGFQNSYQSRLFFHCIPLTADENSILCTKTSTLVVCKITEIEHFILSIVCFYVQELQKISKSGKWRAEETIQEDKPGGSLQR